jgi:N-acetylneuraminic acid mutarotase
VVPPSPTQSPTFTPAPTTAPPRPAVWTSVGDVPSLLGPTPFAVTLRDGRVLLIRRVSCGGCSDADGAVYDPTTRSWSGASRIPRGGSATMLGDGTVLVAGGGKSGTASQLYDPETGRWVATGSMTIGRSGPETSAANTAGYTATLLVDGRVLVAGGVTAAVPGRLLANAEIYDPIAGRWSATGSMVHARANHTATLLPDGRVLVAGGSNPPGVSGPTGPSATNFDSVEIYDPQTGTWTSTESMPEPRAFQTATLLPDGTVLVVGGGSDNVATLSTTAAYDPRTGRWMSTGNLSMARVRCTATLLPDGSVLIAGGYLAVTYVPSDLHSGDPHSTATAERYDPTARSWTPTASMSGPRGMHTAVLLADGSVLVAGGGPSLAVWYIPSDLYDPGNGQ